MTTIWRDWLTDNVLGDLGLNERQKNGVWFAKQNVEISNCRYRELTDISESKALRDLRELVKLGVMVKSGGVGRNASYTISRNKPVINPS